MPIIDLTGGRLTEEQRQTLASELGKRSAALPCPRCANPYFTIMDGVHNLGLSGGVGYRDFGAIPAAVTICNRCGFIALHALTVLTGER
jgi:hypothetical protein